jgi:hypothetical protein
MGAVILAIVLGLGVIGVVAFYARLWWLGRKARRSGLQRDAGATTGRLIDAEYTVVEQRDPTYPTDTRPRDSREQGRRDSEDDVETYDDQRHGGR